MKPYADQKSMPDGWWHVRVYGEDGAQIGLSNFFAHKQSAEDLRAIVRGVLQKAETARAAQGPGGSGAEGEPGPSSPSGERPGATGRTDQRPAPVISRERR